MSDASSCPDDRVLSQLSLGLLNSVEASELLRHLETCARCADRLDQSDTRDDEFVTLLSATAAHPASITPDERKEWESAHQRLRDTAQLFAQAQEPLDFLEPAQDGDELGRLGSFRVVKLLGRGGMGLVFQAHDPFLGREVALKVLRPSLRHTPGAAERFLREARSGAGFHHEHVVPLLQVGESNGVAYLVMPLLLGETLADRLDREGPLPVGEAIRIVRQAAEGLAAVHAAGLVHRDLKPSNLWVEAPAGRVLLLDLGLALRPERDARLTGSGLILGTPSYMAPEQVRGEAPAPSADLFSLGCILYEALIGVRPFVGRDVLSTLASLAADTPASPHRLRTEIPAGLSKLVLQLLAKDPTGRPASAREVADRLAGLERASKPPVRRSFRRAAVIASVLAAGLLLLAAWKAPSLLGPPMLGPPMGAVRIELDDADLEPVLAAADLRFVEATTGQQIPLRAGTQTLLAGTYRLPARQSGNDFDVEPTTFLLGRGTTETVRVRRVPPPAALAAPRVIDAHPGEFHGLAYSPDGRYLATAGDSLLRIWDTRTWRKVREWTTPGLAFCFLAYNADGRQLAGCFVQDTIVVWNPETGAELHRLSGLRNWSSGVEFHPDGRRLLSTTYQHLAVWDLPANKLLSSTFLDSGSNVYRFSIHPEGRYVATPHQDRTIGIWDLDHLSEPRLWRGHTDAVGQTAFHPDGHELATASLDGTVRVWSFPEGKDRLCLNHSIPVTGVAWHGGGRRLVASLALQPKKRGGVSVWDAARGRELFYARLDPMQLEVASHPAGRQFATAGADGKVRIWEVPE